ncbi:FAD-binding protein [Desulfosediminicola flagellatus]|uniref:FAD-dependent oxidoreductase n=1 Tax=Desulfosediminicola flagellatus TaxID=2569541 RepID=UPI0010AB7427|nr:FAD-binding protein [Desulfosediminicola flagellatus]
MNHVDKVTNLSRRHFMSVAGGAAGLAALSAFGLSAARVESSPNISTIDIDAIKSKNTDTDVLVVGSGMAGLFAAVKAHDAGARVVMVSKGRLGTSGQTPFARGIFAYDHQKEKMSIDQFVAGVSHSAIGTNNPVFTRQLAAHSLDRVNELREWGFFDSPLYHNSFSKPIVEREIPIIERVMLTHLIEKNGRINGAAGFSLDEGTIHFFSAKSVILCTGAGGFKPNGFPICDLTHDGTTMAYKIGAKVTGKEWNDGHPSNRKNPASVFSQWGGMLERPPGTTEISIRHDLGVDLNYGVYKNGPQTKESGRPMFIQEKVAGGPYRPEGFDKPAGPPGPPPGQDNDRRPPGPGGGKSGKPPGMGGVPSGGASAGMSIHKAEGLVPINASGESNIQGLYAAGDALGSHMAGGIYTQIGSSLAGSAVQGAIAGEAAASAVRDMGLPLISTAKRRQVEAEIIAPLKRERGYSPAWVTQTLQSTMIPNFVLYVKKERLLTAALAYIEELRDSHQPMLIASDMHELRLAHETESMILNAEMKLRASIMRKESRCSHYRLDYPDVDRKEWDCWINLFKDSDGNMALEKQFFDQWPS